MFWARAWQARCKATGPSSGERSPGRSPRFARPHNIFGGVRGRARQLFDAIMTGQDQRPFEFQHQRARRGQRHNVIAVVDPPAQLRRNFFRASGDGGDVTQFQLRHAAAARVGGSDRDPGLRQNAPGGERRPQGCCDCRNTWQIARLCARVRAPVAATLWPGASGSCGGIWAPGFGVNAGKGLDHWARQPVVGACGPVDQPGHGRRQAAVAIGPWRICLATQRVLPPAFGRPGHAASGAGNRC